MRASLVLTLTLMASSMVHSEDFFTLVRSGTSAQVAAAIQAGAPVAARDEEGRTPLMAAAASNSDLR